MHKDLLDKATAENNIMLTEMCEYINI